MEKLLGSRMFSMALAALFTLLVLWSSLFLNPLFPRATFFTFPFPYWFPIAGFVLPFWALAFGYGRLSLVWLLLVLPLFMATNVHLLRHDVYFLWLCLLGASLANDKRDLYNALLLILAGMYVWTGAQKIHPGFVDQMAVVFQKRILPPGTSSGQAELLVKAIPVTEILLGILCVTRFRIPRMLLGALVHVGILYFLIRGNWNTSMVFWNIALTGMVLLLPGFNFGRLKQNIKPYLIPAVVALTFPVLSMLSLWPMMGSWNMYSGRVQHYYLPLNEAVALNPPAYLKDYVYLNETGYFVSMTHWADIETGGTPCMEPGLKNLVWEDTYRYIGYNIHP